MQTQIPDIIIPAQFTAYQVENSLVSTKFFQSGVVAKNGLIADQLAARGRYVIHGAVLERHSGCRSRHYER